MREMERRERTSYREKEGERGRETEYLLRAQPFDSVAASTGVSRRRETATPKHANRSIEGFFEFLHKQCISVHLSGRNYVQISKYDEQKENMVNA